jgi:5-methyltetrahydrofolate--homocysteine methyltransferase
MDESGMPNTAEERFAIAKNILIKVKELGLPEENLYFDPLIRPVSTEPSQAKEFLRSIPMIKGLGKVKTICGLSNVSYGLPDRKLINSVFLTMAIADGLDAAILDPTDKRIMSSIAASGALLGTDEYCAEYIGAFRAGRLI